MSKFFFFIFSFTFLTFTNELDNSINLMYTIPENNYEALLFSDNPDILSSIESLSIDGEKILNIKEQEEDYAAYLFAFFLGNSANQERMSYAISLDGYHFKALNKGEAVWKSDLGTGCIRDPFISKVKTASIIYWKQI